MSEGELERMTRRYTAEICEFIGPERDVPAPDVNTNEQTMAWIMDTYSMHKRHTVTAVVTGKPLELGGSRGTAGSHRTWVHVRHHAGVKTLRPCSGRNARDHSRVSETWAAWQRV